MASVLEQFMLRSKYHTFCCHPGTKVVIFLGKINSFCVVVSHNNILFSTYRGGGWSPSLEVGGYVLSTIAQHAQFAEHLINYRCVVCILGPWCIVTAICR
jgi:hypothetical protein